MARRLRHKEEHDNQQQEQIKAVHVERSGQRHVVATNGPANTFVLVELNFVLHGLQCRRQELNQDLGNGKNGHDGGQLTGRHLATNVDTGPLRTAATVAVLRIVAAAATAVKARTCRD